MFSDSVLLFWTFVSLAATFSVGAYTSEGTKARNLWIVAVAFILIAFVLGFGFPTFAARYAGTVLRIIWILYPLLTVSAVALLTRDLRTSSRASRVDLADLVMATPKLPKFAGYQDSKWKPDIEYRKALDYFIKTVPRGTYHSLEDVKKSFHSALVNAKVTAWGKAHPTDDNFVQIAASFWSHADPTIKTNYVYSSSAKIGAYDVRLSKEEIEVVWPPRTGEAA